VHLDEAVAEDAAEAGRDVADGEEGGVALLQLVARVPDAEEIYLNCISWMVRFLFKEGTYTSGIEARF
jgi:hypothetical protein